MALSRSDLLNLARGGAAARLAELRSEIDKIYRTFPDLKRGRGGARGGGGATRRRRGWTAAQRRAAAERMRKYWAARRSSKK